jgi:hypothetical protein
MAQFGDFIKKIGQLKKESTKLTKDISENGDKIQNLIYQSFDVLENCLDICSNPKKEVQIPLTKVLTLLFNSEDGLMEKVIDKFKGYSDAYENSSSNFAELLEHCRENFGKIYKPVFDVKIEIENSYTKFQEHLDTLSKPLKMFIENLDVEELKEKELKDKDNLETLKKLFEDLVINIQEYNKSLKGFNNDSLKLFEDTNKTNNFFSEYIETKILGKIKDIPENLNKGTLLLPEIKKKINSFNDNKRNTEKEKKEYYDKCLVEILEMTKKIKEYVYDKDKEVDSDFKDLDEIIDKGKNEITQKAEIYYNDVKDLMKYGKQVIEIINEIRKLFDLSQIKINIDDKNIEYPFNELYKNLNILLEEIKPIKTEIREYLEIIIKIFENQINMVTLDILFIIDITESMEDLLEETRNSIKYIVEKMKAESPGIDIRFACQCFSDFSDPEQYYEIDFVTDIEKIKKLLGKITAQGGGDDAEDVAGGIHKGLGMSWKSNARYAILITDAPGHGRKYHENDVDDDYLDGDPNGLDLEDLMKKYVENNINLCLTRIDNYTDTMYKKLMLTFIKESKLSKNKPEIQLVEYETEKEIRERLKYQIGDLVSESALRIYNSHSKKECIILNNNNDLLNLNMR